ncbi:hypothetical protein NUSPORA_01341 [Nucleospora cyclopteri]
MPHKIKISSLLNKLKQDVFKKDCFVDYIDVLLENECILQIDDDFYCKNKSAIEIEEILYLNDCKRIQQEINADEKDIEGVLDKLHAYNEAKDRLQVLLGQISEIKGITIKKVMEEFDIKFDE